MSGEWKTENVAILSISKVGRMKIASKQMHRDANKC